VVWTLHFCGSMTMNPLRERGYGWTTAALVIGTIVAAAMAGCGDGGGPSPAHSASYFPVRGTSDAGGPLTDLRWRYRINGGQPTPFGATAGTTITYDDEDVNLTDGNTRTVSDRVTLTSAAV
jgi:hypothetical protein